MDKSSLIPQCHLRVVHLVYHLREVLGIIRAFFRTIPCTATNKLVTIFAESEIFLFEGLSLVGFFGHLDFLRFVICCDSLGGAKRASLGCSLHIFHIKSLVFAIRQTTEPSFSISQDLGAYSNAFRDFPSKRTRSFAQALESSERMST